MKMEAAKQCKKWIADDMINVEYLHSDKSNKKANNAALVVSTSANVYLVFRGAKLTSKANWIHQNFKGKRRGNFAIMGEIKGNVHSGFYDAQESVWTQIQLLEDFDALFRPQSGQRKRNLYIAGHSLGGAMAIITAARLVHEHKVKRMDGVYTFGSPGLFDRVATAQYRKHPVLKGRTFRVKYKKDAVPKSLSIRFFNPGASIRLTERDGMSVEVRRRHDADRFAEITGQRVSIPLPGADVLRAGDAAIKAVKAHRMRDSYLATIDFMADQAGAGARPGHVL